MKGVILLAVMHVLIIYQSQKKQAKRNNNKAQTTAAVVQPAPAPQPGSSSVTTYIPTKGYSGYGNFMSVSPRLKSATRLF